MFRLAQPQHSCSRLGLIVVLLCLAGAVHGETLNVAADSNIFGAGHSSPVGSGAVGVLPPVYAFNVTSLAGAYFTFSVSGGVILNAGSGDNVNNADGIGAGSSSSSVNSIGGISGISGPNAGFLVGVFETNLEPGNPAPSALDFTSLGTTFSTLFPLVNQTFFIGDGLTGNGTGATQRFFIPEGATRLFLGIADAPAYHGDAGGYGDNTGQFVATFSIVPEPPVISLMTLGAFTLLIVARLRQCKVS